MIEALERCRRWMSEAVPSKDTRGWEEVEFDAAHLFSGLAPLRLHPDYALRYFLNGWGGNASSRLYAVPKQRQKEPIGKGPLPDRVKMLMSPATENPEQAWSMADGLDPDEMREPLPPGALGHFMLAVEGDGSPFSYLLASFLARDGEEIGAAWHGVVWGAHRLLTRSPFWSPGRIERVARSLIVRAEKLPLDIDRFLLSRVPGSQKLYRKKRKMERQGKTFEMTTEELLARFDLRDLGTVQNLVSDFFYDLYCSKSVDFLEQHGREPERHEVADLWLSRDGDFGEIALVPRLPEAEWEWPRGAPSTWELEVKVGEEGALVTFLTFSGLHEETIIRHRDTYARGSYLGARESIVVGHGGPGYIH